MTMERVQAILLDISKKPGKLTSEAIMKKYKIDADRLANDLEIMKEKGFVVECDASDMMNIISFERN